MLQKICNERGKFCNVADLPGEGLQGEGLQGEGLQYNNGTPKQMNQRSRPHRYTYFKIYFIMFIRIHIWLCGYCIGFKSRGPC